MIVSLIHGTAVASVNPLLKEIVVILDFKSD